jgi:(1->4)-alpha-D-glucan 1-alpha-D-glucosylmutase
MLASSTHDTKRSEDVRVRIDLLSEMPELWNETARRWSAANDRYRIDGMPDRDIEYLIYQTLVGAWPVTVERVLAYAQKASKEAKAHTSWIDPLPEFDRALASFVTSIFEDAGFVSDLEAFVARLIDPGRVSSLSQTLLKLTAPGIPDIYQGTDLWDLSLVDPDNRRPVDYAARRSLLALVADASPEELWEQREGGAPKLALTARTLRVRSSFPRAFGPSGTYEVLSARGAKADHVVAFCRGGDIVTIVPRLVLGLGDGFGDTTIDLTEGSWRSEMTGDDVGGGTTRVSDLLARFPVALLWRLGEHR